MEFLKISLSRPRDILVIMQYMQRIMKKDNLGDGKFFSKEVFDSNEFQNNYSKYFMSSLKDQLSFYYSSVDFEHFLKLFDFFKNADFTYEEYISNYDKFIDYILENAEEIPEFIDDKQKLLQLLYDSNIITAIEIDENGKKYFHFSYKSIQKARSSIRYRIKVSQSVLLCSQLTQGPSQNILLSSKSKKKNKINPLAQWLSIMCKVCI